MSILDLTIRTEGRRFTPLMRLCGQRVLMEHPFFSLGKQHRTKPIVYQTRNTAIHVAGDPRYGMATIWDADILIWATSRINEAVRNGSTPSPQLRVAPYRLLRDLRRGVGSHQYVLLKQALDRLMTTTVTADIRRQSGQECFTWIEGWHECVTRTGRKEGIDLFLSDWVYRGASDPVQSLVIDPIYFQLGGLERWLYLLARKHAGRQPRGWLFEIAHLHAKSGSLRRPSDFACRLRQLVRCQRTPGYRFDIIRQGDAELLHIRPVALSTVPVGNKALALRRWRDRTPGRCCNEYAAQGSPDLFSTSCNKTENTSRKESKEESKYSSADGDNPNHGAAPDPEDGP